MGREDVDLCGFDLPYGAEPGDWTRVGREEQRNGHLQEGVMAGETAWPPSLLLLPASPRDGEVFRRGPLPL